MRTLLSTALLVGTLAACVDTEPPQTSAAAAMGDPDLCPRLICGNTPFLGLLPFWELDATGTAYASNGLRVTSARFGAVPQRLEVVGFEWSRLPVGGLVPAPIAGTTITLGDANTAARFELSVSLGPAVPYYEGGNDGTLVPTYRVSYVEIVGGKRRPPRGVCGQDPITPTLAREAIVFHGDRYDATTGVLMTTGASVGRWFNIACKDDALWKLALMRHVEAAQAVGYQATPDQRRALLRSIRADYCGDGTPLTELGTSIDWINSGGWLTQETDGNIEALWGPKGAKCLDETRLPDIDLPCARPPSCAGLLETWPSDVSVLTLVPEEE